MPQHFAIIPYDPKLWIEWDDKGRIGDEPSGNLRITVDEFEQKLLQRWSESKIYDKSENGFGFSLREKGEEILCGRLSEQQYISFFLGDWEKFRSFVIWYRGFIPEHFDLYFWQIEAEGWIKLVTGTTERDIDVYIGIEEAEDK
jgi:hypothetical protein